MTQPTPTPFELAPSYRPTLRFDHLYLSAVRSLINEQGNYRLAWYAAPQRSAQTIAPRATLETAVQLPPGSIVWGISGSSSQAAGFQLQLVEARTREQFFSTNQEFRNCTGQPGQPGFPVHRLPQFHQVLSPGLVNVQIVNQAASAAEIEVVLWVAQPV